MNIIKKDNNLEILATNDTHIIVKNNKINKKYKVELEVLKHTNAQNILAVFNGREPIIMDGITRVCGYMSKISNWNKSKIGELQDRRKGNYRIGGLT